MPDFLSKETRSKVMAAIRSKGNKDTELLLASIFRTNGISGWRRQPRLVGRPDFVFPKERLAVFIDGCFWHGCRWHCRMPKSRLEYWRPKIERNRRRDKEANRLLLEKGWKILRIWEHSLRDPKLLVSKVSAALSRES
ncbi:MAG: very short patch repair endonuclease [Chloroflexi bacterium]|nr:very short patch repair endonuclease [Chloroflexota bacterium]MBE3118695.1 very short patch repair endonuclease [Candidatus Atribacteria bacterium]